MSTKISLEKLDYFEKKAEFLNAAKNKELEAFFHSVTHDLQEPLQGIDEFSQAFLENYASSLDDQGKHFLIRIRASSQRMRQLFNDIVKLEKISFDRLKRHQVDLSALARKKTIELKEGNPERKAKFIIQEGLTTNGDSRLLTLVIDNLFNNAWMYTAKKSQAKIEFGVAKNEGNSEFFIKDNGTGFKMEHVDKMFRPFQRLNAKEIYPGTGMGLAIIRRIIHRHGGLIRAEGEPDKGATFYFRFS